MAIIDFGGVKEEVITREEFPMAKAREVLKNEVIAVIGYGVQGPAQALTGPIVRGDSQTVKAHLAAMTDAGIDTSLYRLLGSRTVALAQRRGAISRDDADTLLSILHSDETSSGEGEPFGEELVSE